MALLSIAALFWIPVDSRRYGGDEVDSAGNKMIERSLGVPAPRKIPKRLRHCKVTVLCLLIAAVVLATTATFDMNGIIEHLYRRKDVAPPDRHQAVEGIRQAATAPAFDVNKASAGDGTNAKPYSLGPKISDWDEKRAKWLERNRNFPNFTGSHRPRVLLVTGSSPKPCDNAFGDDFLIKSIKNKIDYCRLHGMEIFYNMAFLDGEMSGFWSKLPLIRKLMLFHPEVELFWWVDSDAMFTDMAFEVPWERYKDHNLVLHGWSEMVYDQRIWYGLNTGSFLLRNCQWSLDMLDAWAPMGPKGENREEAGKVLTRELKGRPAFEADDQSAMVYLLATQRERWGDRVYLERAYYLHGYWGILVDQYEEMAGNHRPGLGDDRWPLVTHFTGCKPCGYLNAYLKKCMKHMDRAFNFGDNQILRLYGFAHESLNRSSVKRIQKESSKPLEVEDELGLLHPPFKSAAEVSS